MFSKIPGKEFNGKENNLGHNIFLMIFFISDSTFWFAHLFKNDDEEKNNNIRYSPLRRFCVRIRNTHAIII